MTAQERQAIGFLLALTALGTGVRVVRARGDRIAPPADSSALAHQLEAVDSAVNARRESRASGRKSRRPERRIVQPYPPPSQGNGLDISAVPERRDESSSGRTDAPRTRTKSAVDLDVAGQTEIESLPWVGPALASRIIENRKRCGPFGSLQELERVAGVGPRLAERLSPYITFSLGARTVASAAKGCS